MLTVNGRRRGNVCSAAIRFVESVPVIDWSPPSVLLLSNFCRVSFFLSLSLSLFLILFLSLSLFFPFRPAPSLEPSTFPALVPPFFCFALVFLCIRPRSFDQCSKLANKTQTKNSVKRTNQGNQRLPILNRNFTEFCFGFLLGFALDRVSATGQSGPGGGVGGRIGVDPSLDVDVDRKEIVESRDLSLSLSLSLFGYRSPSLTSEEGDAVEKSLSLNKKKTPKKSNEMKWQNNRNTIYSFLLASV